MSNEITSEVTYVTPKQAKILRQTCHFERQRPISNQNINRLVYELQRDWFIKGTPIFMGVLPDKTMVILNGSHTLEAIAISGVAMFLTFIYHPVKNMEEAARIYVTMDMHKTRSWNNIIQATGMQDEIPLAKYVLPAVGLIMQGFSRNKIDETRSRFSRMEMAKEYSKAATVIAESWKNTLSINQRILRRAAFFAVALETAKSQPSMAEEFWGGAAMDDGLAKNDPRKLLLVYGQTNKAYVSNQYDIEFRAAALCWNAFFEKRNIDNFKPVSLKIFRLAGTAWYKGDPNKEKSAPKSANKAEATTATKKSSIATGVNLTAHGAKTVAYHEKR